MSIMIDKIRMMSDVHLEFSRMANGFNELVPERNTLMVLAGDIMTVKCIEERPERVKGFLGHLRKCYGENIVAVSGNHEYYGGQYALVRGEMAEIYEEYDIEHLHYEESTMDYVTPSGIPLKVFGGTMWTDFNDGQERAIINARYGMNDYRQCQFNMHRGLDPHDTFIENYNGRKELRSFIQRNSEIDCAKLVVTHHLPHELSDRFGKGGNSYSYINTGFDDDMKQIDFWIHGHSHEPVDYIHNGCRVVSNPRGYYMEEEMFGEIIHYAYESQNNPFNIHKFISLNGY